MEVEKLKGRDFWDSNSVGGRWKSYKEKVNWVLSAEPYVYELLTEHLLKEKLVLDCGCGPGLTIPLAAKHCSSVVGLDYSIVSLEEAKRGSEELNLDNVHLLCADIENLPFSNDRFEIVYSVGVLHHTPDTQKAITEIFRVLKPTGRVVVMVYRKYNPKWLAVIILRTLSRIIDGLRKEDFCIANYLRRKYQARENSPHGTALLELFGCPTLKMYSNRQARQMFNQFTGVRFQCYQPGFSRLLDFLSQFLRGSILHRFFAWFDRTTANTLGFYLVIRAEK